MSHIFLDRREGRLRLYLNGDMQFAQEDERLYHEPLALVPTVLAARRRPDRPLRVLILGGGDGLALLFAARWLTDWLLLPGVTIRQEVVGQEVPNIGVGYLEALFYLGTSFLIAWTL